INNMDLGNYQEALTLYEKAISLEPKNLNYIHGKAIALKYLGNWEESKQLLEKIVKESEILTQTKVALGMMYLTEKNFEKGMPLYIKRSLDTKFSQIFKDRIYNKSIDLSDKTVLLFSDCGLGDTIMCARYLPEIVKKSKSVVLQTDKELVDILQYNFPMVKVISKSEKYNNYDTVMPIMDIMYALNSDFNSIPLSQGYIKPVKFKQKKYSELFDTKNKKVGICFRGNNKIFKNRLIPFENVRVLFNIPGITYYSFQMKKDRHNFSNLVNLKDYINDYSDTCSLLSNIDIMLTIDSSIAHMAGAMGKTVFLLLPKTAEWRWFNDEETTPWYDSIKIFKQTESGNWNEVIKRVCKELLIYESK
ncbi:MAG: tetratricopeptide repeat protein, partial [Candidatus Gastranaerophilales bacterium]|nr:tetratricopeptide repeat protein [Candidatus Gastranaerophilales bacterium]